MQDHTIILQKTNSQITLNQLTIANKPPINYFDVITQPFNQQEAQQPAIKANQPQLNKSFILTDDKNLSLQNLEKWPNSRNSKAKRLLLQNTKPN